MSSLVFEKFDDNGRQLIFDPSSLNDALKCLRYYKIKDIDRWRSKESKVATQFGKLVHASLEEYDKALILMPYEEACNVALQKALSLAPLLKDSDDTARTPESMVRAVGWYIDKYRDDPFRTAIIDLGSGPEAAIELRFEVEIPTTPWRLSGRLDRLAYWGDELLIVDRKTTKVTLSNRWFQSFMPGMQFACYLWAMPKMGIETKGILVEGCQTMVSGTRWERQRFTLTQEQLQEFQDELIYYVNQIDQAYKDDYWPMRRSSCNLYGGCELRFVCNATPNIRQRYLEDKYEIVPYVSPDNQEL